MVGTEVRDMVPTLVRVVIVMAICTSSAFAAGSDCKWKKLRKVERLVCSDQVLTDLHEEMLYAYAEALVATHQKEVIKAAQREWLKKRDACPDVACIAKAYEERIIILQAVTDSSSMNARRIAGTWKRFKWGPEGPIELIITSNTLNLTLCNGAFALLSAAGDTYTFYAKNQNTCYPYSIRDPLNVIKAVKDNDGSLELRYYSCEDEKYIWAIDFYFNVSREKK